MTDFNKDKDVFKKFIKDFLFKKLDYRVFENKEKLINNKENRKKIAQAVLESLEELGIDITSSMVNQTISNILDANINDKIKNTFSEKEEIPSTGSDAETFSFELITTDDPEPEDDEESTEEK